MEGGNRYYVDHTSTRPEHSTIGGGTFGKIVRVLRTCNLNSECITCIIGVSKC